MVGWKAWWTWWRTEGCEGKGEDAVEGDDTKKIRRAGWGE